MKQPHDVALSKDNKHLYVVEIGPNRLWKFDIYNNEGKEVFARRVPRKLDTFQVGNIVIQICYKGKNHFLQFFTVSLVNIFILYVKKKHQKSKVFLMFSRVIKWEHWSEMD